MCSFNRLLLVFSLCRRRPCADGIWVGELAAPFFLRFCHHFWYYFDEKYAQLLPRILEKKRLFRSITSCARAVLPLLLLLASGLSKLQPSTISSFSPRKKLRVRFENGKIFSDSRGNRQANWNLDNFLHLFTPCNLPTFGEVVTWKSWRLARQLKLLREEQSKPS